MPLDTGIKSGTDMIYSSAVWSSATDPCSVPYLAPGHGHGVGQRETSHASEPKAETTPRPSDILISQRATVLPTTQSEKQLLATLKHGYTHGYTHVIVME